MSKPAWKQSRAERLQAHAKETRRAFHAKRPGLRPGDPYVLDRISIPKELWGAWHPEQGLVMLPWFYTPGIVREWLEQEMPQMRPEENDGRWVLSGPWTSPPIGGAK